MSGRSLDHSEPKREDLPREILKERYEIQRRLGKKAGRQTLLAQDLLAQEPVVVKILTFSSDFDWDDLKLFEREAETLQVLTHPAIPRYLDSFQIEDSSHGKGFALVQSYIPALSLEEQIQAGRSFNETQLKELGRSLLEILVYLHERTPPVIHRDVKPSNILLTEQSGSAIGQVYLVDFGSVQTLATKDGKTVTVVGTYGYMPPEQFGGRAVPASDLYGVGATLIAAATGYHPADLPQGDLRIRFEHLVSLSPAFSRWLSQLIEPDLTRRLPSAQVALQKLEQPWFRTGNPSALDRTPPVTTLSLFWTALWRSTAMGAFAGALYGGIYGTVLWPGAGTIIGGILGGMAGVPLGLANGLLIGLLTRFFFFPLKTSPRTYRRIVRTVSTLVCMAGALIGFAMVGKTLGTYLEVFNPIFSLAPTVIAALSMGAISQEIARWYAERSRQSSEFPDP